MSALYALGVNNVLVKINNSEVPILDGSAKLFVEGIQKVGLERSKSSFKIHSTPKAYSL